jgi:hypothetical protein
MQKIIIQTFYLKSELKTYLSNNFYSTYNAVQITYNNHWQQYNYFVYSIYNLVYCFFWTFSCIFGTYSIKTKDANFTPGTKTIFPISSSTGTFLGLSGYIIIDAEDEKRFITIVIN